MKGIVEGLGDYFGFLCYFYPLFLDSGIHTDYYEILGNSFAALETFPLGFFWNLAQKMSKKRRQKTFSRVWNVKSLPFILHSFNFC